MRVAPDDEVYRVNTVWLGPRGLTFPWTARYLAYATWLATFSIILLIEAVTPLSIGIPPVWELCITTLVTYTVMGYVDHERPLRGVWHSFKADVSTPRPQNRILLAQTKLPATLHPVVKTSKKTPKKTPKKTEKPRTPITGAPR